MFQCDECGRKLPEDAKVCPNCGARVKEVSKLIEKSRKQIKVSEKAPKRWNEATQYQISSGLSIIASLSFLILYLYYRSKALSGGLRLENTPYINFFAGVSVVLFLLALVYYVIAVTRK
jgi:uncharacterized membrane protein YvbJ